MKKRYSFLAGPKVESFGADLASPFVQMMSLIRADTGKHTERGSDYTYLSKLILSVRTLCEHTNTDSK